ncbi:hypothetical protein [Vibrio sp. VPAP30]|uniref:hypothetical protein n=1 Tax=Vibrio sp. VPAP30 TaxID=1647102 RepID=UPI000657B9FE|nr:hypothetical protein [Vibrio sp. VPAP30]KLN63732.1 hypothetical protein ZX61_19630 [Vibrio sp. VPAP30]
MNKKLVSLILFILISHLVTFSLADGRGKVFFLKLKRLVSQNVILDDDTCYMISRDWLLLSKNERSYGFMYLDKKSLGATIAFGKNMSQIPEEKRSWIRLEEEIRGKKIYLIEYNCKIHYFSDVNTFEAIMVVDDKGVFNYPMPLIKTNIDDCSI